MPRTLNLYIFGRREDGKERGREYLKKRSIISKREWGNTEKIESKRGEEMMEKHYSGMNSLKIMNKPTTIIV